MPIISDLLSQPVRETDWLVYPILGRQGITFFHGKSSLGKTPLAWEIARAVSVGESVTRFGLEVRCEPASVLYVEAETALRNTLPRLHALQEPIGDWWYEDLYEGGADILNSRHPSYARLAELSRKLSPDLVIWSSVRRFHSEDMKTDDTVVAVYRAMVGLFPQAGHLCIAHDKKSSHDPEKDDPSEAFSGSNAWVQQASVGLHITGRAGTKGGTHALLTITKSQLGPSKEWTPYKLHLDPNSVTWHSTNTLPARIAELWPLAPSTASTDRAEWVAGQLGVSRRTIYAYKPKESSHEP